jgi:hypothetical protein
VPSNLTGGYLTSGVPAVLVPIILMLSPIGLYGIWILYTEQEGETDEHKLVVEVNKTAPAESSCPAGDSQCRKNQKTALLQPNYYAIFIILLTLSPQLYIPGVVRLS